MNQKYTFAEFVGAIEGDDFDNPTKNDLMWGNQFVDYFPEMMKTQQHGGDCTKEPYTCPICIYQTLLTDYEKYVFDEENWRKENL